MLSATAGIAGWIDRIEECSRSRQRRGGISQLALPNDKRIPTERFQAFRRDTIPNAVRLELRRPIFASGFRNSRAATGRIAMRMPDATMNEDHFAPPQENQIGSPRKLLPVQAEAVSRAVKKRPQDKLRARILAAYRPHDRASLVSIECVGHARQNGISGFAPQTHPRQNLNKKR